MSESRKKTDSRWLPVFLTSKTGLTYQGVLAGLPEYLRITREENAQSYEHKAGEKGTSKAIVASINEGKRNKKKKQNIDRQNH